METTNLEQMPNPKRYSGNGNEEKGDHMFKMGILNLCS